MVNSKDRTVGKGLTNATADRWPAFNQGKFSEAPLHHDIRRNICGRFLAGIPVAMSAPTASQQKKPATGEEASAALLRMGQTLRAEQFSFQVRTIRVYGDASGDPLHIFHTMKVTVHRPNRMLVDVGGDDGDNKLLFDGKNAVVYSGAGKKYAMVPVPGGTIQAMMEEIVGRLGVDLPIADFLTERRTRHF